MMIDKKTIKIIFEFEPDNLTEKIALGYLIGPNVVNAVRQFKIDKKTVEDTLTFFQKIQDLSDVTDLLGE